MAFGGIGDSVLTCVCLTMILFLVYTFKSINKHSLKESVTVFWLHCHARFMVGLSGHMKPDSAGFTWYVVL